MIFLDFFFVGSYYLRNNFKYNEFWMDDFGETFQKPDEFEVERILKKRKRKGKVNEFSTSYWINFQTNSHLHTLLGWVFY